MKRTESLHEQLDKPEEIAGPSDRKFGVSFAVIFALIGAYTLWRGKSWAIWWCLAALLVLGVSLARPTLLRPFNRAWLGLGLLLFRVVNPVVMALLFYLTVLPIGLILRAMGKNPLRLRRDPSAKLNVARSEVPAVTRVDYSARVQTVHSQTNPRYHARLTRFKALTGCPVLINTSFNVRGEPIVCMPEDAFRRFMGTEIEALAVGNCWLRKEVQDPSLKQDYKGGFELD